MSEGSLPLVWRPEVARVLVIDDSQDFRAWARCELEREGLVVLEARDGLAGLQRSVEDAPDLVIVSESLTGLDGVEVTERLAGEPATSGLPVLVVSERPDARLLRAASEAGAQGVVPRSFCGLDLVAPVREALWARGVTWMAASESVSLAARAATN